MKMFTNLYRRIKNRGMIIMSRLNRGYYKIVVQTTLMLAVIILVTLFLGVCKKSIHVPSSSNKRPRETNGNWYTQYKPYHLFIYSAYYDDRPSIGEQPKVQVIGVADKAVIDANSLLCLLDNGTFVDVTKLKHQKIGYGVQKDDIILQEFVMSCDINSMKGLKNVGLFDLSLDKGPRHMIPIQFPAKPKEKEDFAVCTSISYWQFNTYRLIEWLELHRLLGVSMVAIYNNSLGDSAAEVFKHYAKENFVKFYQSHNYIHDNEETTIHLHMSPVINDCIYKYMYSFKKIIVVDLDEIIVPRQHTNYTTLLAAIETNIMRKGQRVFHPGRSYMFNNVYLFLDFPPDYSKDKHLAFLRYRTTVEPSGKGYSVKSIIDPMACIAMHNHVCLTFAPDFDVPGRYEYVDKKLAMNQHYKRCHFSHEECFAIMSTYEMDDTMLRFETKLLLQVSKQAQKMGLKW